MSRETVHEVALAMGIHPPLIRAWYSIMASMRTMNCLGGGGVGLPYARGASIPQGCPLSMLLMSMVLRPMICITRLVGAVPRVLADDITLRVRGQRHWKRLKLASRAAIMFIGDIGGKVSTPKCKLFSTDKGARLAMRLTTWPGLQSRVPVVMSSRDLGSQVNFGLVAQAGILHTRMQAASRVADHIGSLPVQAKYKLRLLNTKAQPMALYGCEATPIPARAVVSLGRHYKEAILEGVPTMGNQHLAFSLWGLQSPEPLTAILIRRAKMLRSMWHSSLSMACAIDSIACLCGERALPGTLACGDLPSVEFEGMVVRPPTSQEPVPESRAEGPIQLFYMSLARIGLAADSSFNIYSEARVRLSLLHDPWPLVRRHLMEAAAEHIPAKHGAPMRASLGVDPRVDWASTKRAAAKLTADQQTLLRAVHAGSIITPHELYKAGAVDSEACRECGALRADLRHMLWCCPAFEAQRAQCRAAVGDHILEQAPDALMLHGLAPPLMATKWGTLWHGPQPQEGALAPFDQHFPALCAANKLTYRCLG